MKPFAKTFFSLVALCTLAIVTIFSLPACSKKSETKEIKIGVVGPLTGEGATYGESMRRGFDLAFQGDPQFKLIYEDDKLLPKEGVAAINKLISSDKVQVVLGSAASGVTLAMAPIAEKNRVILISSISTSDNLRNSGEYVFRNVPRNEIQGITAATFLFNNLGKKNVIIFKKNDEYANNLSSSFRRKFQELGGVVLLEDKYEPGTNDFKEVVAKFRDLQPQGVYVPGNYQEVALFLRQAYEGGLKATFIGGDGSYSPELIALSRNAAEGSYYTIMAVRHNDYYKNFEKKFVQQYSREPDVYDAYAFEAASIVLSAVKEVGNDATKIKEYLLSHTFDDSLTGPLRFDQDGEVNRQYGIIEVKDGKFVEVTF
jgi:branched-chain amino acid transport system substrate-binding protein